MLDVCLLGCGGSLPVPERNLTALLMSCKGKKFLIDCGEGTQVSMKILGWGFKSIDVICFTHAHADHVIGLPGLLLTIANSDRTEPLTIIGPPGFDHILQGLMVVCPQLPYEIVYKEASMSGDIVYSMDDLYLSSFGVDHNIPCCAYSLTVKRGRKFDVEKARGNNIPQHLWSRLQKGESIICEDVYYTPEMVLGEERDGVKVSYFTDTRPLPGLVDFVSNSNLLIAEGMYGEDAEMEKAVRNKHMLFSEAAEIARDASAEELWLTHFSPSMPEPEKYLDNAASIFNNTKIGQDRLTKTLTFK